MPTLGAQVEKDLIVPGSRWQLLAGVNGYEGSAESSVMSTQAASGRRFEVIGTDLKESICRSNFDRLKVRLLEDGYICWVNKIEIIAAIVPTTGWEPKLFSSDQIRSCLPAVISWVENACGRPNKYLWGGTIGPDFDCSGMIQAAFSSQGIWLPRDAYQQERFCRKVTVSPDNLDLLHPGDLLFFGSLERCTHVALYKGAGFYWHSSGLDNGRNGIGCDGLHSIDMNPVACYYRAALRGAGRVERCHDGTTLS